MRRLDSAFGQVVAACFIALLGACSSEEDGPVDPGTGGTSGDASTDGLTDGPKIDTAPPDVSGWPEAQTEANPDSISNCPVGFGDCDGNPDNECETDVTGNTSHCGACQHDCLGGSCQNSRCQPVVLESGQSNPTRIVVDSTDVYWTNAGTSASGFTDGEIRKMPKVGGSLTTLASGLGQPNDIALDSTAVYWTNQGANSIGKVLKTGGTMTDLATGLDTPPWGLMVQGTSLYFTMIGRSPGYDDGEVASVGLSGGALPTTQVPLRTHPTGIAVTPTDLFWTSLDGGEVETQPKSGGLSDTVVTGQAHPIWVVVVDDTLYWANFGSTMTSSTDGSIMTAGIDGSNERALATDQEGPSALVVDATHVYFTNADGGTVNSVPLAGGSPTVLASGQDRPVGLAQDATALYWTAQGSGDVLKVAK